MTYEEWEAQVPADIKSDRLWEMELYSSVFYRSARSSRPGLSRTPYRGSGTGRDRDSRDRQPLAPSLQ